MAEKYVVLDLEFCGVKKNNISKSKYKFGHEIIQMGAVLLDDNYEVVDCFSSYVRPEYGSVDSYIENLTGISRIHTKKAPKLDEVFEAFVNWLAFENNVTLVTWSENDECQIRREMDAKKISNNRIKELLDYVVDCQKLYSERVNSRKKYALSEAMIACDLIFEGHEHNSLDDAFNTAKIFKGIKQNKLAFNPDYANAMSVKSEHLNYSLSAMLSGIKLQLA